MSNDIRKNIMLIDSIILDESFKDAQAKFTVSTSSEEVKSYIEKFKELSKRNIIKGQDKDIGFWIKGDWDSFKKFVDNNSAVVTNRQSKVEQKKDSIVVYKDDNKQVVIPLTKEASIQYGKNTAWCTAYTDAPNQFNEYFYIDKVTLLYVLFKDGNKYACAFQPEHEDTIKCFNQQDESISVDEFEYSTGVYVDDIWDWYRTNDIKIEDSRDLNKAPEEIQISAVKDDGYAIEHIDNPSEAVQLAAVNQNGYVIVDIDNPSEAVQLAATNGDGYAIQFIIAKGIVPSEKVQLVATNQNAYSIQFIDNPSEEVQLAAVNKDGFTILDITDKGIDPSEEVKLAAVNQNSRSIKYIDNPSEEVQLAAVTQNGRAIEHIDNPSEEVQLAAVTKTKFAISHIHNPSEKVKALHKKLWT